MGDDKKYPRGKLCADDDGELEIFIRESNGLIKIDFGTPVSWFVLYTDQAAEIGARLINLAKNAGLTKPLTIEL